jgi:hypothetical protein
MEISFSASTVRSYHGNPRPFNPRETLSGSSSQQIWTTSSAGTQTEPFHFAIPLLTPVASAIAKLPTSTFQLPSWAFPDPSRSSPTTLERISQILAQVPRRQYSAENPEVTVTIVQYQIRVEDSASEDAIIAKGIAKEKIRIRTSGDKSDGEDFFVTMQHNLSKALRSRVTFRTSISYDPVQDAIADAQTEIGQNPGNGGDLIMLGRSAELAESQASSCLGLVADVMLERDVKASIVVVQARKE